MLLSQSTEWIILIIMTVVNGFIMSVFAMFRGFIECDAWRLLVPTVGLASFLLSFSLFWTLGWSFYLSLLLGTVIGISLVAVAPKRLIQKKDENDSIRRIQLEMARERLQTLNGLLRAVSGGVSWPKKGREK